MRVAVAEKLRVQEILELEASVNDAAQLFTDLASIVDLQQESLVAQY